MALDPVSLPICSPNSAAAENPGALRGVTIPRRTCGRRGQMHLVRCAPGNFTRDAHTERVTFWIGGR